MCEKTVRNASNLHAKNNAKCEVNFAVFLHRNLAHFQRFFQENLQKNVWGATILSATVFKSMSTLGLVDF